MGGGILGIISLVVLSEFWSFFVLIGFGPELGTWKVAVERRARRCFRGDRGTHEALPTVDLRANLGGWLHCFCVGPWAFLVAVGVSFCICDGKRAHARSEGTEPKEPGMLASLPRNAKGEEDVIVEKHIHFLSIMSNMVAT